MATLQTPMQASVENLLTVIKQLSPAELREFKRRFADWQNNQSEEVETDLIKQTRLALSPTEERRLKRLMSKSERGTLTEEEMAEYGVLAQRAEALAALVRRRGMPVEIVKKVCF